MHADEDHREVAASLDAVGKSYAKLQQHQEALEYMLLALSMWQRIYPDDHPLVAASLYSVGCTHTKLG